MRTNFDSSSGENRVEKEKQVKINVLVAIAELNDQDKQYANDLAAALKSYPSSGVEFVVWRAANIEETKDLLNQADIIVISYPIFGQQHPPEKSWESISPAEDVFNPANDFFEELGNMKGWRPDMYIRYDERITKANERELYNFSSKYSGDLIVAFPREHVQNSDQRVMRADYKVEDDIIDALDSRAFIEKMKKRGKDVEI